MQGELYGDSHNGNSVMNMPPSSSQPEQVTPKKRKAPENRKWTADYLLQNPKSPLVNVDLLVCN